MRQQDDRGREFNVSPTCEVLTDMPRSFETRCGKPTTSWYPAMGGGAMALCDEHGERHAGYAFAFAGATPNGERETMERDDSARLDWLEKSCRSLNCWMVSDDPETDRLGWSVEWHPDSDAAACMDDPPRGRTPREAIDYAMKLAGWSGPRTEATPP